MLATLAGSTWLSGASAGARVFLERPDDGDRPTGIMQSGIASSTSSGRPLQTSQRQLSNGNVTFS
jgi:hypothetical protein